MSLDQVRQIADAVLYEGYLLYPYRASSDKNRSRWQFGVLGPPSASPGSFAEDPGMSMECLLRPGGPGAAVSIHLRFLQVQARQLEQPDGSGGYRPVRTLPSDSSELVSWDEAVEREITVSGVALGEVVDRRIDCPGGVDIEPVCRSGEVTGRVVRSRDPLTARLTARAEIDGGFYRLSVAVRNETCRTASDKDSAARLSLVGAHLLIAAHDAAFVSLLDPPDEAVGAAGRCHQRRCYPVLAGPPGATDVVLGAPIILYDYPEIAAQSPCSFFDSTEIDEILTLRVMTMTDQEKAEARATDPRARAIIDRCEEMSPADMQQLHGILRQPAMPSPADPDGEHQDAHDSQDSTPWWDPETDAGVRPEVDTVVIAGTEVSRGSIVRIHPSRRADAQDLFLAGELARVTAVLSDVDGGVHVALVLLNDPAADLHEWYGRYLYFAPEELEPIAADAVVENREDIRL